MRVYHATSQVSHGSLQQGQAFVPNEGDLQIFLRLSRKVLRERSLLLGQNAYPVAVGLREQLVHFGLVVYRNQYQGRLKGDRNKGVDGDAMNLSLMHSGSHSYATSKASKRFTKSSRVDPALCTPIYHVLCTSTFYAHEPSPYHCKRRGNRTTRRCPIALVGREGCWIRIRVRTGNLTATATPVREALPS